MYRREISQVNTLTINANCILALCKNTDLSPYSYILSKEVIFYLDITDEHRKEALINMNKWVIKSYHPLSFYIDKEYAISSWKYTLLYQCIFSVEKRQIFDWLLKIMIQSLQLRTISHTYIWDKDNMISMLLLWHNDKPHDEYLLRFLNRETAP